MCKKVKTIGKIPIYQFCDELLLVRERVELWRDRMLQANHEYQIAMENLDKIIKEHQRI